MGYVPNKVFPKEFDETCFGLKLGEISPVVKTDYGFHIFKLIDKKPKGILDLNEVLPRIESELLQQKMVNESRPWLEKVLQESVIQIREDILSNLKP